LESGMLRCLCGRIFAPAEQMNRHANMV
jgi:hypothetical protein